MNIKILIALIFTIPISIIDIKTYTIPDPLLAGLIASFIVCNIIIKTSLHNFCFSFLSSAALFALFFLVFRFAGGIGFGDVKFAGVIGYALGFQKALYACLAASLLAIVFFAVQHAASGTGKQKHSEQRIPFGPFLSLGLIIFLI